ncbi:MAG: hypothetical protein WB689_34760 [Xanthobacteraceae bacterium]
MADLSVQPDVIEALLNHVPGHKASGRLKNFGHIPTLSSVDAQRRLVSDQTLAREQVVSEVMDEAA